MGDEVGFIRSDSSCIIGYFDGMFVRDFCALFKYTTKTVKCAVEKGVCQYFVNCRLNAGRIWASTPRITDYRGFREFGILATDEQSMLQGILATDEQSMLQGIGFCFYFIIMHNLLQTGSDAEASDRDAD